MDHHGNPNICEKDGEPGGPHTKEISRHGNRYSALTHSSINYKMSHVISKRAKRVYESQVVSAMDGCLGRFWSNDEKFQPDRRNELKVCSVLSWTELRGMCSIKMDFTGLNHKKKMQLFKIINMLISSIMPFHNVCINQNIILYVIIIYN